MTEPAADSDAPDPRWGQCGREGKGEAILRTLQRCVGADLRNAVWLDIGCGNGGIAATLAPHVTRMLGIDPEAWRGWAALESAHGNLTLRVGSWRDLGAWPGDAAVDVVVCNQVYEHVDDAPGLIQAIARVLKPGGACYFAGPNLLWPIEPHVFWPFVHWLPRAFAQRLMRALGSKRAAELDAFSAHYWRLRGWFRAAGLRPQAAIAARVEAALAKRSARLPRWFALAIDAFAPLSPGFVFCLRKPAV